MQPAFLECIDRFPQARVLVVGDVMQDQYIYGEVNRISPEAPIPVFSITQERVMLGGAGNVARNLVSLGAKCGFVSVIGKDGIGHQISSMIGKEPLITPYLLTESGRISTTKTRYVAGMQQVLRADHETSKALLAETARQLVQTVIAELEHYEVLILSDYGKGVLTRATLEPIIAAARNKKVKIIVDPKSRDFSLYRGATCVSPNLNELANAAAQEIHSDEDIVSAAKGLIAAHDFEYIMVTRSKDGMTLIHKSGEIHHIPARAQEVFDVSGAGDTAIAILALGVAAELPLAEAAGLANLAAGIVVGRPGTAVVTAQDIKAALFAQSRLSGVHKILPLIAATAQVELWKREGKRVGFTNGCFDLMHSGHLSLLHTTRQHCDKLIVALNSDDSVKRLKGASRPINGEVERALLLASLSTVDMVVLFEEDTPIKLIEGLKPDLLAKGADYQKHQVVGHEIVERAGGKILLVPIKEGYSTTGLIQKMA